MTVDEVLERATAMSSTNPAFPPGPHRCTNREFLVGTHGADIDALSGEVVFDDLAGRMDPKRAGTVRP